MGDDGLRKVRRETNESHDDTVSDTPPPKNKMGYLACTSYVVGNIIGSGIFITPTSILYYTKSVGLSLSIWLGCGLISLMGAICYIELGTSILEPGCDFAYTVYVGWQGVAFAFMWVSVLMTYPASAAVQAQTFGQYIVNGLDPIFELKQPWQGIAEKGLGFVLVFLLTLLNFFAIDKYAARFQVVVTVAKMLVLAIIICTGFYLLIFKDWSQNLVDPFEGSVWEPGKLALAFYGGLWSYAGWDILNYGTPEIHKPKRTMPLALLSGIVIVAFTYFVINVAYFVVLTPAEIANSTAVGADFAKKTLGDFSYAVPFMVAILLIGTLNSNIFCGSRFMYAAARERHLPACLSCVHVASGSPRAALVGQLLCTYAVSFVNINTLINYVTFVMWGQRAVTIAALLWLRYKKMPVADTAIRIPIVLTIVFFFISLALVFVPFIEEPQVTAIGVVFVFSGLIFYILLVRRTKTPAILVKINDWLTKITVRALRSEPDLKRQIISEVVQDREETRNLGSASPIPDEDEHEHL